MSGKSKKGAAKAVPRAYGRLTRHERDTVQRMLERGASCREIARELGRSPSTVSAEVASHRFVTAPKARRGERVDASADLSAACPRLAAWPRCCNGCGRYRAIGCKRRPHVFYEARAAQLCADSVLVSPRRGIDADEPAWALFPPTPRMSTTSRSSRSSTSSSIRSPPMISKCLARERRGR